MRDQHDETIVAVQKKGRRVVHHPPLHKHQRIRHDGVERTEVCIGTAVGLWSRASRHETLGEKMFGHADFEEEDTAPA